MLRELLEKGFFLISLRHNQGQRDRGPLDLRLPRLVVDLQVRSLGHVMGWMIMMRKKCTRGRSDVNWARLAQC